MYVVFVIDFVVGMVGLGVLWLLVGCYILYQTYGFGEARFVFVWEYGFVGIGEACGKFYSNPVECLQLIEDGYRGSLWEGWEVCDCLSC